MIKLNDIDKTVIDEKEIKCYKEFINNFYDPEEKEYINREAISLIFPNNGIAINYETKEARDKDIELLDKIFDVKSIEYKAMSVEKPTGYVNVMKPEYELVSELSGEGNELVKKEEYLTWDYVKQNLSLIKAKMPNGATKMLHYNEKANAIIIKDIYTTNKEAIIYNENLFNALMLKKVE